ncbi:MAG: PTS sugar transporter subunit IIC [Lactobacillus sp.]|nr:PTS sugar transporter subunit IIC [Lactobacillus sp.]
MADTVPSQTTATATAAASEPETKSTVKDYVYTVSAGVSNVILVMLGIGLLTESLAGFIHWQALHEVGTMAKMLLAPAFGAVIAATLKTNTLVLCSSMIASTVGANSVFFTQGNVAGITATGHALPQVAGSLVITSGQPISAVAAGLIAALVGKYLTGKTPLDMMLVPLAATLIGGIFGLGLASVTTPALLAVSKFMAQSMQVNPVLGAAVISLTWGLFLMTPASSAALAIALTLDPLSAGAALVGTTAQFVGFLLMTWRQNNLGANIAQGVITPKIQFPNLLRHPQMAIPPFVAAIVSAPIAVSMLGFKVPYELGGLGLNSFIAPINLASTNLHMFWVYLGAGVILPAVITMVVYFGMKAMGLTREMHVSVV